MKLVFCLPGKSYDRQFLLAWCAYFAHDQHIKRSLKRLRDLESNWHTTTRQRKDNGALRCQIRKLFRQLAPGIPTIFKYKTIYMHGHSLRWVATCAPPGVASRNPGKWLEHDHFIT